ncbi:unnamed protein product [Blepharisma stoltei]|uniref:Uncharacterized protein n=1 Tax=Blepharisma stoltei TaxID=1481888 RepID=A0AAU9JG05_9CILI|nr:unnamed protein product [Blepharisma stoltei]
MTNLRVVSEEEGLEYAAKFGVRYFEISAKTGDGVAQMFDYISTKVIESMDIIPNFIQKSRKSFLLATSERRKNQPKSGGCCK